MRLDRILSTRALVVGDRHRPLNRRARRNGIQPTVEMGIVAKFDILVPAASDPRKGCNIGDRVVLAGKIGDRSNALVDNIAKPITFPLVALDRVWDLIINNSEVVGLAEHRPDAAHLEHKPFQRRNPRARFLRHEAAMLLCEVNKDRAGLEYRNRATARAIRIDNRWDLVVRRDLQKIWRVLLALADMDGEDLVRQFQLFEDDQGLRPLGVCQV